MQKNITFTFEQMRTCEQILKREIYNKCGNECFSVSKNRIVGGGVQTGSSRHVGHFWPIVPAPCDCEDEEFDGMKIGRGNRNTRRKPALASLAFLFA
jgi:hypothetical protein